jgi:glycosyltransferase involved in cell wall biosynthesis
MVNNHDAMLQPLLISTADDGGGAALGARQLHTSLREIGVDSRLYVFRKATKRKDIIPYHQPAQRWERFLIRQSVRRDKKPLKLYQRSDMGYWSVNNASYSPLARVINRLQPDVVHLHWVADGFVPIQQLRHIQVPIIWTLRDMWAMTGGCHYAFDCEGFTQQCGQCPQLNSHSAQDLSRSIWQLKHDHWRDISLTIVGLSHWIADEARRSSLLGHHRIEVIPNGIDTQQFKPLDQAMARHALNLPDDKKLLLFGAFKSTSDKTKGFDLLQTALTKLSALRDDLLGVVFGAERPENPPDVGMPLIYLGTLRDTATLALAYSSADAFVTASRAESFNKTLTESMACGTPTVAFALGGHLDIVTHQEDGYLATPLETDDLVQGIQWILNHPQKSQLDANARQKILTQFEKQMIAQRIADLYIDVIQA